MKLNIVTKLMCVLAAGATLTSCLEGDEMNTPPGAGTALIEMSYVSQTPPIGTTLNTGLRFFGGQSILMSPAIEADTLTFAVTTQGPVNQDVNVTLHLAPERALDNFGNDGLEYAMLAPNQATLLSTTATIPAGERYAEFQLVFYPPNIDFTSNWIIPITVTNDAGITVSQNHGVFYPHIIGNAIAGAYLWDFIRYGTPDASGDPDITFYDEPTVFAPTDPTTIQVPTGYYTQINYIITFENNDGELSNFKVVLDPDGIKAWEDAGIKVVTGPDLTVSADHKEFTVKYTTLTRNVTDIYTLQE